MNPVQISMDIQEKCCSLHFLLQGEAIWVQYSLDNINGLANIFIYIIGILQHSCIGYIGYNWLPGGAKNIHTCVIG